MKTNNLYGLSILAVLLGASSYGLLTPLTKLAFTYDFTVEQITVHQFLFGSVVLWILVALQPSKWSKPDQDWLLASFAGIAGIAMTNVLLNHALASISASLAVILLFQFTWLTIVVDCVARRVLPTRQQLIAISLVLVGTVLAVGIIEQATGPLVVNPIGVMQAAGSAVSYTLFLFVAGRLGERMNPSLQSAVMITAGFLFVFLFYLPYEVPSIQDEQSIPLFGWALALALVGQVFPTYLFNYGIRSIGSSLAAIVGAVELPVAIVISWLLFAEPLTRLNVTGIFCILIGIVVAEWRSRERG